MNKRKFFTHITGRSLISFSYFFFFLFSFCISMEVENCKLHFAFIPSLMYPLPAPFTLTNFSQTFAPYSFKKRSNISAFSIQTNGTNGDEDRGLVVSVKEKFESKLCGIYFLLNSVCFKWHIEFSFTSWLWLFLQRGDVLGEMITWKWLER